MNFDVLLYPKIKTISSVKIIREIRQVDFYKHQQFEPTDDAETFLRPEEVAHVISGFIINAPAYVPAQVVLRPQRFELRRKK